MLVTDNIDFKSNLKFFHVTIECKSRPMNNFGEKHMVFMASTPFALKVSQNFEFSLYLLLICSFFYLAP